MALALGDGFGDRFDPVRTGLIGNADALKKLFGEALLRPVAASDAARVIAANYGDCRVDADRLSALQAWIAAQAKATAN